MPPSDGGAPPPPGRRRSARADPSESSSPVPALPCDATHLFLSPRTDGTWSISGLAYIQCRPAQSERPAPCVRTRRPPQDAADGGGGRMLSPSPSPAAVGRAGVCAALHETACGGSSLAPCRARCESDNNIPNGGRVPGRALDRPEWRSPSLLERGRWPSARLVAPQDRVWRSTSKASTLAERR